MAQVIKALAFKLPKWPNFQNVSLRYQKFLASNFAHLLKLAKRKAADLEGFNGRSSSAKRPKTNDEVQFASCSTSKCVSGIQLV